uniref:Uncharacterized protein n=1 Tax=Ditylenchus dipsaci TaxID=166011 RepID=A0A915D303_9BILA
MESAFYTERGKMLGFCNGFSMIFRGVRHRDGLWRGECSNSRCGGTATSTNRNDLVEGNGHHGHLPDVAAVEIIFLSMDYSFSSTGSRLDIKGDQQKTTFDEADTYADVRILVLGDKSVGKTSIIMALLEDKYCKDVPARIETILIPPDVTPDGVITEIIDYSPREQDEEAWLV